MNNLEYKTGRYPVLARPIHVDGGASMITVQDIVNQAMAVLVPHPRIFMSRQERDLEAIGFTYTDRRVPAGVDDDGEERSKPVMRQSRTFNMQQAVKKLNFLEAQWRRNSIEREGI